MSMGDLITIYPTELKFSFELRKQSSCYMQLTNKTETYVAFKVKTTNPKKYCVRPNSGIVLPGSSCYVTFTMQAQKEAPPEMKCRDKFLIQSVVVPYGATSKDITRKMFDKEYGRVVEEFELFVSYIPANPSSPVPEAIQIADHLTKTCLEMSWSVISKLTDEKSSALQENQRLRQELKQVRKDISRTSPAGGGFYLSFVVLVALIGVLIGYIIKRA
ncbi:hypothetical protein PTKIN_Ptkin12aG0201600 [Pterospermum kingtungense]